MISGRPIMSETQERDCSECTWLYQCAAEQDDDRPELCVQNPNIITSDSGNQAVARPQIENCPMNQGRKSKS